MRRGFDWAALRQILTDVSQEDARLLELLANGESTPEIAKILGEHRSRVWRRAQALKQRVARSA